MNRKFLKRLWRSRLGFKKIKQLTLGELRRWTIVRKLRRGGKLNTRRDLQTFLGGPALINDPEVSVLQKYADEARSIVVEIGPAYGGSTTLFLLGKRDGVKIYSIDPFVKDSKGDFRATPTLCRKYVVRALASIGFASKLQDWSLMSDYSYNIAKQWSKEIDLLFVDGDHNYDAVKRDFEDWFKFVKNDGLVLFHDSCRISGTPEKICNHGWPGPSRLVEELKLDHRLKIVEQIYSLSVLKKTHD